MLSMDEFGGKELRQKTIEKMDKNNTKTRKFALGARPSWSLVSALIGLVPI